MFPKFGEFGEIMKNAGKIREAVEKAAESLGNVQVEGTSGGGAVAAKVNGRLEVLSIRIEPKLVADGDVELLEDLVSAAVNQALAKARESAAEHLRSAGGGLPVPDFSALFGPQP